MWVEPWPVHGKRPLHPGTGKAGNIVQGRVENHWDGDLCKQTNKSRPDGNYTLGRLAATSSPSNRNHVMCRGLNYHPDGGQVFYPTAGNAFVMLLALPGDDVKLEDFVAFYFDGSCGMQIKTGKHNDNLIRMHYDTVLTVLTSYCRKHSSQTNIPLRPCYTLNNTT